MDAELVVSGPEKEAAASPVAAAGSIVSMRLGGTDFGIPVERVREVVRVPALTRLPFPPPSILGVVGIRGAVLPVMDLGERLLGRPADREGRLVVVQDPASASDVALLVDSVPGLVSGVEAAGTPPPEVEASLPAGWIAGVIVAESGRLVTVLDIDPVLALTDASDKETR